MPFLFWPSFPKISGIPGRVILSTVDDVRFFKSVIQTVINLTIKQLIVDPKPSMGPSLTIIFIITKRTDLRNKTVKWTLKRDIENAVGKRS